MAGNREMGSLRCSGDSIEGVFTNPKELLIKHCEEYSQNLEAFRYISWYHLVSESEGFWIFSLVIMTKKATEGTSIDVADLRTILEELQKSFATTIQTSIQNSVLQLGESLTARMDAMTTLLTHLDTQNHHGANIQQPQHHHQRPQQQQDVRRQQRNQPLYPVDDAEDDQHHRLFLRDIFKVEIPEFHRGLRGDDLVDWLITVEEILEFKQKQLKATRSRTGKPPIQSWEKLSKHLCQTFLPHNYERTMYTRLQNLRQGNRSVDEYAEEFSLLLTRNEINDSQVQLVSRFIGGLRPQIQTAMAQFDPSTIGEAHRRAASFEQQSRSSNWAAQSNRNKEQSGSNAPSTATKDAGDTRNRPSDDQQDLTPSVVILVENKGTDKRPAPTRRAEVL
uniref:Retrotransposon gag domain-containing protein n=1 Tax=Brassica oleracea var. oleracea TaxID=109376 RepID=A0A0D3D809_BRAOL